MKKIFSIVLALMLFCSMTVTATAESFQLSADKTAISAGDKITVTVKLDETLKGKYRNVQGQVNYNTNLLTYVSHEMGSKYAKYSSKNMTSKKYFTFSYTDLTASGVSTVPQGEIATIVFKTNKNIKSDTIKTSISLKLTVQDLKGNTKTSDEAMTVVICKNHKWKAATCTTAKVCTVCKLISGKALGHSYGAYKVTKKATFGKAGVQTSNCTRCKNSKVAKTKSISKAGMPKLSATAYTFNNKQKTPTVKGTGLNSKYYTVKYASGRKNVGSYKVTVTLKGNYYTGSKTLSFKINPAAPTGVKLTKGKKQIKVSWKKPAAPYRNQIDGYQIRYAVSKSKLAKAKPVTVSGKNAVNKTLKKLKAKTRYYVQVRTYNKIGKTTYVSGWTTSKSIKVK